MNLEQLSVIHISGIKKWFNIIHAMSHEHKTPNQYILEHRSKNGSQIATFNYNESIASQKAIPCNMIHDKYGKYLKMCEINYNATILISVLEDGRIMKWSMNNEDVQIIPAVPIALESIARKTNPYERIQVSDNNESLLVSLKDTKRSNIHNIWIYDENIQLWFNTEYVTAIEDAFKSYTFYNDTWYILAIASDTAMSFEIHLSINTLSIITDDEISETVNEDVSVSTNCDISIDLSHIQSYLTNKVNKILWDLPNKLIVLLFDEFIIWINIQNDNSAKPLYVITLAPSQPHIQNIKFRDIIFICNGMIAAVVTNHGSILFYQRLSTEPILFNYDAINTKQTSLKINWKKRQNNSFKLHTLRDSNLFFVHNGNEIAQYQMDHFRLRYMTSNPLAFIQSNHCIECYLNNEDITQDEQILICSILSFGIANIFKEDVHNKSVMDSIQWIHAPSNKIWERISIDVLKHCKPCWKQQDMLKLIQMSNSYFGSISKCMEIKINQVYHQMIDIINSKNTIDILEPFDVKNLSFGDAKHKLHDIMILILFEDRSQIIMNSQVDNLIDILWRINKLHSMQLCTASLPIINIAYDSVKSGDDLYQQLKQWLDLQFAATNIEHKMIQIIHNNTDKDVETMNKETFATLFWRKCSENQKYLISNRTKTDCNIIEALVDMLTSNITELQTVNIKKVPMFSIYTKGKREELYDSEVEIEEHLDEEAAEDEDNEEETNILTPQTSSPNNENISIKTQQSIDESTANVVKSIVSSYGPIAEDVITPIIEQNPCNVEEIFKDEPLNEDHVELEQKDHILDEYIADPAENIMGTENETNCKRITLDDIAPYVSSKYIMDQLANKLSKEELIELFAKKMEMNQKSQRMKPTNESQATDKWKLVQYDNNKQIIPNQQISSRLVKKIKKYLRKKNKLMRMKQKRKQHEVQTKIENVEANEDSEMKCNHIQNKKEIIQENEDSTIKEKIVPENNLTTTISNNISFICNSNRDTEHKNKYELCTDTFHCAHIAPSKTIETQTSPTDFILDTKYVPPKDGEYNQTLSNWFVAPLMTSNLERAKNNETDSTTETMKAAKHLAPKNEQKESEMQTMTETSEFVPIPVIGARTAGLSYIDPSMKINENNLMLQFPATHNCDQVTEIKEDEEDKQNIHNIAPSLFQSQCTLMMHTVNNSININTTKTDIFPTQQSKINIDEINTKTAILPTQQSKLNIDEFQHDIAVMDAQIANLSSLCNNIQNNYYTINKRLDNNEDVNNHLAEMKKSASGQQIGTMEAWSLLESIQENLDSIDQEMSAMNSIEDNHNVTIHRRKNKRTHQLKKLKSKTKTRRKQTTKLSKKLGKQTEVLAQLYENFLS